jgi:hypothetical protein
LSIGQTSGMPPKDAAPLGEIGSVDTTRAHYFALGNFAR